MYFYVLKVHLNFSMSFSGTNYTPVDSFRWYCGNRPSTWLTTSAIEGPVRRNAILQVRDMDSDFATTSQADYFGAGHAGNCLNFDTEERAMVLRVRVMIRRGSKQSFLPFRDGDRRQEHWSTLSFQILEGMISREVQALNHFEKMVRTEFAVNWRKSRTWAYIAENRVRAISAKTSRGFRFRPGAKSMPPLRRDFFHCSLVESVEAPTLQLREWTSAASFLAGISRCAPYLSRLRWWVIASSKMLAFFYSLIITRLFLFLFLASESHTKRSSSHGV